MKKRRLSAEVRSFASTFIIFFMLCSFVVTVSFLIFFHAIELPEAQIRAAAPLTFINILAITTLFVSFDTLRRKITVDRPVNQIKRALKKITSGDFTVKLDSSVSRSDFSEIMESINKMTDELSGVETLRTDFVANVSHEMKTPLAVISNYSMLLQDDDLTIEQRHEYAATITNSAKRLAELMTNILKLNRLENQQIYPQSVPYNLSEQLCDCLLQFEPVWEEKEIEIETEIEEDVLIDGDAQLLELVWNNLLSNAFKFTGPGGRVKLTLVSDKAGIVITIRDTGCGMSHEIGSHIFEKFYQGDTSHATSGNGLGLALVKRVMDIIGGEISVNSALGNGSTFTVKLPQSNEATA